MYEHVLLAVDGSDEARQAAERGLALARRFDAAVTVLAVLPERPLRLRQSSTEADRLREHAQAAVDAVVEVADAHDQAVATQVTEGKPAVAIDAVASERDADLVVLGRQGLSGLSRRVLGGVTEQVLARSDVPVLVVPEAATGARDEGFERLLLPTDGSDQAARAVPHAVAVARRDGAALDVLSVVDVQGAAGPFDAGGLDADFLERLDAQGREAVEAVAERVAASAPDVPVATAVERTTSFEGPAAGIRAYVEDEGIDLVVMGSHGRSNLRRQLLGSVAARTLRTVDVPVLVATRGD
jgi:nucleotide-binding universal stress UspA family protein